MADPKQAASTTPSLAASSTRGVSIVRWPDDQPRSDIVVVEEPLEVRIDDRSLAVTMRTPGADLELAAGFLCTEGIIDGVDDLISIDHLPGDSRQNTVVARLAAGVEAHIDAIDQATREIFMTSACGICGKVSLDRIEILATQPIVRMLPDPAVLASLPDALRARQELFARTGGLHAAALVTASGDIEVVREDIGRHNAVDKVVGWRILQDRVPISDRILLISGRAGFEIVQKARVAGIPVVAAMGAASSLAVELAEGSGIVLIGFLRGDQWTRYT